jgi:hypothetical protein
MVQRIKLNALTKIKQQNNKNFTLKLYANIFLHRENFYNLFKVKSCQINLIFKTLHLLLRYLEFRYC